jgi:MFS family permease
LQPGAGGTLVVLHERKRFIVLGICSVSLFMVQLDNTVVNVALPSLQRQFHGSVAELQWVVDAYLVVLASLLLLGGSLGDRFGRRRVLRAGLVVFGAGPLLGGAFIQASGWRAVFWVNVPVALAAVVLLAALVHESRAAKPRRLDPAGQGLAVVALGSLTYGVIEGPSKGWTSGLVLACVAILAAGLAALVYVERHQREPLIEMRFFRSPPFSGALAMGALSFFVVAGWLFLNTLHLQEVRGYPPFLAGVAGGVLGTFRQVGSALGVAVLGSVVASSMHGQLARRLASAHLPATVAAKLGTVTLGGGRP